MKDPQFVGISLFPTSLVGLIVNWAIVVIIVREKSQKSPFIILTLVKSFCDAVYLTVYFVYITPMIILSNQFLITHSNYVGYILIVFYEISIHTHFVTSLNRFCAVFFPFSYKRVFSEKSTKMYLMIVSIVSFLMMSTVTFVLGCELEYNPNTWVSFYDVTIPICSWYAIYGDFIKNLILVFSDAIIDVITLLKVQKMRRAFRNGRRSENYAKRDMDFLKQTCGQGLCYMMGYASYLMVPEMNSNKYVAFFMSLLSWCLIAMLDGLFTIIYNSDIRSKIFKQKEISFGRSTIVSVG